MLGTLAKYIFGGMLSDAPEETAPEMQYHTREVNDWLLVDMPDQAIDDEDIDSESDDDEILTALPLLMAEEVNLQSIQIVQSFEEVDSACDNSSDKIQLHFDKIRSVPLGVQHHSSDKNQGNFVDKVEAISVELEDDFHTIQDISIPVKEICDNTTQDTIYAVELCNNSFQATFSDEVQNCYATVVKNSIEKNQYVSPKLQNSCNKTTPELICKSNAKIEDICVEDNSYSKIPNNPVLAQEVSNNMIQSKSDANICDIPVQTNYSNEKEQNSYDMDLDDSKDKNQYVPLKLNSNSAVKINCNSVTKVKNITKKISAVEKENNFVAETKNITVEIQKDNAEIKNNFDDDAYDEVFFPSTEVQKVAGDTFISNFVDKVESNTEDEDDLLGNIYDIFSEDQYTKDKINVTSNAGQIKFNNQNTSKNITQENSNTKQIVLHQEQGKSYQQRNYKNELKPNDEIQDKFISGRRLYSHVVQGYNDNAVQVESKNTNGKIISNFVDKVEPVFVEVEDNFSSHIPDVLTKGQNNDKMQVLFVTELDRLYDQYVSNMETKENLNRMQGITIQAQEKLYKECNYRDQLHSNYKIQDNFSCGRKLYSDVVRDCNNIGQENVNEPTDFSCMALEKYVQMKYRFMNDTKMSDDEGLEISDDETDDEMHESSDADEKSDAEIEDSFDAEIEEYSIDRIGQKTYDILSRFYFEDNEEYLEDEIDEYQRCFDNDFLKKIMIKKESYCHGLGKYPNTIDELHETKQEAQLVPKHHIEFMPNAERLINVPDFITVSQYAYQMWGSYNNTYSLGLQAFVPISFSQEYDSFEIDDEYKNLFEEFLEEKSPTSLIAIPNSAEILQNLINQKSTAQPKKTAIAYVKEQIKELKPMQEAIQFDNRKYMTRSQFNRQNRNYIYQSSVKTNRRRNLQRNHSGANNNRKCDALNNLLHNITAMLR